MMPVSDRLRALLDRAREANVIERNRVSLETFLAGLHREDEDLNEAQLKQIQASWPRPSHLTLLIVQLSVYEALLGLLDASKHIFAYYKHLAKHNTATSVSPTDQASAVTTSRAAQTDAATVSLWDLLPKACNEAYDRGFNAGKEEGHVQGTKQGNGAAMNKALAIGCEQGQAEGLKTGLEQGKEAEMQRGIELGRTAGHTDGLAEGRRQAKEEITKLSEEQTRRHEHQKEATRERIVVKLPPKLATTIPGKKDEEVIKPTLKPRNNGVDPFASLLVLVSKK
jgi:flagellar biosynthesis/type III secretory pathway protein FliH